MEENNKENDNKKSTSTSKSEVDERLVGLRGRLTKLLQSAPQKTEEEKKKDLFDFIAHNSSKGDFVHWLLNNTEMVASQEDEWPDIKEKVLENKKVSFAQLRDYAIALTPGKEVEEALKTVKEKAEKAEETAEKLTFLGSLKKLSIAIGGVILFLGVIHLAATALIVFKPAVFSLSSDSITILAIAIFAGLSGFVEILGGLFLMAM